MRPHRAPTAVLDSILHKQLHRALTVLLERSMFTVLFAVARTTGWIAQWNEMITDPTQRIGRPRQLYTGPVERPYKDLQSR